MAILSIYTDTTGQVDVLPRIVKINTSDTLTTILKTNYLYNAALQGFQFKVSDIIAIGYLQTANGNKSVGLFTPVFKLVGTTNTITLQPLVQNNLVPFNVTVGQAALASGGSVILVPSSGLEQYQVLQLQLNSGGTNFSGGSGNRLGQVTDGTTVYSLIPAATMQSLVNAQWGVTALPNPASAAINTATVAGANLTFQYQGGTTDYTAGSLVITGLVLRVA